MDQVLMQINEIALKYPLKKIILFGSRARGEHRETSDYDLAVFSNQITAEQKSQFAADIEDIRTLHKIDLVWMGNRIDEKLSKNIIREGVVIYESIQ